MHSLTRLDAGPRPKRATCRAQSCWCRLFKEKISGVRADRPQPAKLMASLRKGDVVLVTKLDRLGRSTRELLDLVHRIDRAGASFKSLGDPLFDTTTSQGRVLVTMLAAIAEFERELIRERTGEGRKRAMAAVVRFGRPRAPIFFQQQEAIKRRRDGDPLSLIAQSYRVSAKTIARLGGGTCEKLPYPCRDRAGARSTLDMGDNAQPRAIEASAALPAHALLGDRLKGGKMKTFIIYVSLALALTQVGPAWGADDNITALVRGCHVYLGDWEDPHARREEGECIGVVKGLTAAALAQGVDLAMRQVKGIYRKSDASPLFCIPLNTANGEVVRVVIKYIDQHPPENAESSDFALLALRALQEAWPCKP